MTLTPTLPCRRARQSSRPSGVRPRLPPDFGEASAKSARTDVLFEAWPNFRQHGSKSDEQLVSLIVGGKVGLFRLLVERHERQALKLARALVGNEFDASDVVQDAFIRAYRNIACFEGSSTFYTWLYRIVHNSAVDTLRRPQRHSTRTVEFDNAACDLDGQWALHRDPTHPDQAVQRAEVARRIEEALLRLSHIHRQAFVMREIWGMSYAEIACSLGCAKGTVMSRLFHARQRMQTLLRDVYEEERSVSRSA